jgi:hypothetical protein
MKRTEAAAMLNRLLELVFRSLPVYLESAPLYVPRGAEGVRDALKRVAADQKVFAARLAEAILERGGRPQTGNFPLEFTAYHDASVGYVATEVVRRLRDDTRQMECVVDQLTEAPLAQSLAKEILARTCNQMKMLDELTHSHALP